MLRIVALDDENHALERFESVVKDFKDVELCGLFDDADDLLAYIGGDPPDVVFLDIEMPGKSGIQIAGELSVINPEISVVFVTAFSQYAVEAFELCALDYMLKPATPDRLKKTIERLMKKKPAAREGGERKLQIKSLGRLQVSWENREPVKWRTEKVKELFGFLLHHHRREISKEEILEALWAEHPPGRSVRQLYNGIYYIRKTLEDYGIGQSMISVHGNYRLKIDESVVYDADLYQKLAVSLEKAEEALDIIPLEKLASLYQGDYMGGEDWPWAELTREALSRSYRHYLLRLAGLYLEQHLYIKGETVLIKAYHLDPYEESVTELLLRLYHAAGEKSKAAKHFSDYTRLIASELGIKPSSKLQRLYQETNRQT